MIKHNLIADADPGGISFSGDVTGEMMDQFEKDMCLLVEYKSLLWGGYADMVVGNEWIPISKAADEHDRHFVICHLKNKRYINQYRISYYIKGNLIMGTLDNDWEIEMEKESRKEKNEKIFKHIKEIKKKTHNLSADANPGGISFSGDVTGEMMDQFEKDKCLLVEYKSLLWGYADMVVGEEWIPIWKAADEHDGDIVICHLKNKRYINQYRISYYIKDNLIMGTLDDDWENEMQNEIEKQSLKENTAKIFKHIKEIKKKKDDEEEINFDSD